MADDNSTTLSDKIGSTSSSSTTNTPSNTVTFGGTSTPASTTVTAAPVSQYGRSTNASLDDIKTLLNKHREVASFNGRDGNFYAVGLDALIRAVETILRINKIEGFQILWDYYTENENGSVREEYVFRGMGNNKLNINRTIWVCNLYRNATRGMQPTANEGFYISKLGQSYGAVGLVTWTFNKYNQMVNKAQDYNYP